MENVLNLAPVYLTAVVDYWAAEVLELESNAARDRQTPYYSDAFTTRHFRNEQIVVRVTIAQGCVLPNILAFLLTKRSEKKP